jgi:hypothetical protein
MWDELLRDMARFPDAVLTGIDGHGRPTSIRSRPRPDHTDRTLLFAPTPTVDLVDGPASVLCHSHDAALWRLRSFLVRGTLTTTADGWAFTPAARVAGTGMAGPIGDLRGFVAARRRAGRYLGRRSLPRPVIPWAHFRKRG